MDHKPRKKLVKSYNEQRRRTREQRFPSNANGSVTSIETSTSEEPVTLAPRQQYDLKYNEALPLTSKDRYPLLSTKFSSNSGEAIPSTSRGLIPSASNKPVPSTSNQYIPSATTDSNSSIVREQNPLIFRLGQSDDKEELNINFANFIFTNESGSNAVLVLPVALGPSTKLNAVSSQGYLVFNLYDPRKRSLVADGIKLHNIFRRLYGFEPPANPFGAIETAKAIEYSDMEFLELSVEKRLIALNEIGGRENLRALIMGERMPSIFNETEKKTCEKQDVPTCEITENTKNQRTTNTTKTNTSRDVTDGSSKPETSDMEPRESSASATRKRTFLDDPLVRSRSILVISKTQQQTNVVKTLTVSRDNILDQKNYQSDASSQQYSYQSNFENVQRCTTGPSTRESSTSSSQVPTKEQTKPITDKSSHGRRRKMGDGVKNQDKPDSITSCTTSFSGSSRIRSPPGEINDDFEDYENVPDTLPPEQNWIKTGAIPRRTRTNVNVNFRHSDQTATHSETCIPIPHAGSSQVTEQISNNTTDKEATTNVDNQSMFSHHFELSELARNRLSRQNHQFSMPPSIARCLQSSTATQANKSMPLWESMPVAKTQPDCNAQISQRIAKWTPLPSVNTEENGIADVLLNDSGNLEKRNVLAYISGPDEKPCFAVSSPTIISRDRQPDVNIFELLSKFPCRDTGPHEKPKTPPVFNTSPSRLPFPSRRTVPSPSRLPPGFNTFAQSTFVPPRPGISRFLRGAPKFNRGGVMHQVTPRTTCVPNRMPLGPYLTRSSSFRPHRPSVPVSNAENHAPTVHHHQYTVHQCPYGMIPCLCEVIPSQSGINQYHHEIIATGVHQPFHMHNTNSFINPLARFQGPHLMEQHYLIPPSYQYPPGTIFQFASQPPTPVYSATPIVNYHSGPDPYVPPETVYVHQPGFPELTSDPIIMLTNDLKSQLHSTLQSDSELDTQINFEDLRELLENTGTETNESREACNQSTQTDFDEDVEPTGL